MKKEKIGLWSHKDRKNSQTVTCVDHPGDTLERERKPRTGSQHLYLSRRGTRRLMVEHKGYHRGQCRGCELKEEKLE